MSDEIARYVAAAAEAEQATGDWLAVRGNLRQTIDWLSRIETPIAFYDETANDLDQYHAGNWPTGDAIKAAIERAAQARDVARAAFDAIPEELRAVIKPPKR